MTDNKKIKKEIEWLVGKLLSTSKEGDVVSVVYGVKKQEVYKNGIKVATFTPMVASYHCSLTDKQTTRLWKEIVSLWGEIETVEVSPRVRQYFKQVT